MILENKRGAEKLLSVWWFFSLGVIAGALIIGVLMFFNADFNVKGLEADTLAERFVRCLEDNNYLRQDFLQENFNIYEKCSLREDLFGRGSYFYFKISAVDLEGNLLRNEISGGDASLEADCRVSEGKQAEYFPRCSEKSEKVFYYKDGIKNAKLNVLAVSNQEGKRVAVV